MAAYQQHREGIAALPEQRRTGWLCHHFNLLPTDPRIGAMTEEQVTDLWLQVKHFSGRGKEEEQEFRDEEYEQWEQQLTAETDGVLYADTEVVPHGQEAVPAPVPLDSQDWEEIPFP